MISERSLGRTARTRCKLLSKWPVLVVAAVTITAFSQCPRNALALTSSSHSTPVTVIYGATGSLGLRSQHRTSHPITHFVPSTPQAKYRYAPGISSSRLITHNSDQEEGMARTLRERIAAPFLKAAAKFKARPGTYLMIPCIAALVGWFTNYLAVQMIFYPVDFVGIPLWRRDEIPLGLIGWQGIVPCKTRKMSETMVELVTTQLLSVEKVFQRLDPREVARILAPEIPKMGQDIIEDVAPRWIVSAATALPGTSRRIIIHSSRKFLKGFTIAMQENIGSLLNVRNCVVDQMMQDRTKLGLLFRKCGQKELDFLTNSGLWFGFILGLIQMVVALFWDNPWTLSIGGMIVGLATNWLALKWIFEPVNPTKFGPFILQGQFLRRQKEVAAEFSQFFAEKILTSEKLWHSILTDPTTKPGFEKLFKNHVMKFAGKVARGVRLIPDASVMAMAASKAVDKLPAHIGVVHDYVDKTLGLRETLRIQMEGMTSAQFERVLHPIFEEDELTLILAGAVLGFAAGLVQQGLETGSIKIPSLKGWIKGIGRRLLKLKAKWGRSPKALEEGDENDLS